MSTSRTVTIRLFGSPAVDRNDESILLTPKVASLLGGLVMAGDDGASADRLADTVWPGPMPRSHATALRVHVMTLRRTLGDDEGTIVTRRPRGGYRLDRGAVHLDVDRFVELAADATVALDHRDHDEAYDAAMAALELWSDEPYRDLDDAAGVASARLALADRRVRLCEVLATAAHRSGRVDELITVLTPIVTRAPTEERIGLILARALADAGRSGDAVRTAHSVQHALRVDLGVTSQAATDLVDRLQQQSTLPDPTPRRPPPFEPESAVAGSVLVGRSDELDRLVAPIVTSSSTGTFTVLLGKAGVGKTRLLREVVEVSRAAGVSAVMGRADPSAEPFAVIGELVGPEGPEPHLDDDGGRSAIADRHRYRDEVVAWLLGTGPSLIVIDDAPWLDSDSASLLAAALEQGLEQGCHVVVACRTGHDLGAGAERLVRQASELVAVEEVELGELSKQAGSELATALGAGHLDPIDLFDRTGGNALLIREVCRLATTEVHAGSVLVDLVSRRFVAEGDGRELLEAAAPLGRRFPVADLLAVADLPLDRAHAALDRCHRDGVLQVDGGTAEFVHGMVAEIIERAMGDAELQKRRADAFHALAGTGSSRLARLAREAHPLVGSEEAVRAIGAAAAHAYRRLAFTQATQLYEQSLELQTETRALPPGDAAELFVQLARSLAHTDEAGCDEVRRRAVPVVRAAESPAAVLELAEANVGRGLRESTDLVTLLESALTWDPDRRTAARIRARLAVERAESDSRGAAHDLALRAVAEAEASGDRLALAGALRAVVSTGPHRMERAAYRRTIDDLVAHARAAGDLDLEMIGLVHAVIDRLRHRESDQAVTALRGFRILADDRQWPRYQSFAAGIGAVVALTQGDTELFARHADEATKLAADCGFDDGAVMVAGQQVCLAWHQGTLPALVDVLEQLSNDADQPVVAAALACALAETGDWSGARRTARSISLATLPKGLLYAATVSLLASCAFTTDDQELAAELLPTIEGLSGTDIVAGAGVGHFGPAESFAARLHRILGDEEAAEAAHATAAQSMRAHHQVPAADRLDRDWRAGPGGLPRGEA